MQHHINAAATQLNACDTATSKLEQGLEGLREELERLREELEHSNKMVREVSARAEASELALERHRCEAAGFATLAQVAGMMKPLQQLVPILSKMLLPTSKIQLVL